MAEGDVVVGADAVLRPRLSAAAASRVAGVNRRLVVVSNRVASGEQATSNSGGLAVGIRAALRQSAGGIWFGWSGHVSDKTANEPHVVADGTLTFATLDLSRRDFEEYYIGYANRVLWPLFHFRPSLVEFSRRVLSGYLRVNRTFAQTLAPLLSSDDLIWVHDYHLIPLAAELRRADQQQPIGFFLHTPFPPADLLRVLPNHHEIVRMLCSYDLVGFQTTPDLLAFRDYLRRWAGAEELGADCVRAFGRVVRTRVFPIGIDVAAVAAQAEAAQENRHMRRLRQSLGDRALMIGVDRLDYSKGLGARFECYRQLFDLHPETRGRIVFMQIAPPSRSEVPEYQVIRKSLETSAGAINSRYGEFDWTPLRYINKSFHHRILTGFFRASRIALVTPQRDGMNLVAKEYIASQRPEDPGVLVLSCFAGAAHELADAVIVNPYDIEGMAEAILSGLTMPLGERKERWSAMMRVLERNDVTFWRESFVSALSSAGAGAARNAG
ncbi:MAG TPA: trehalose-6-phosphate synthase [Stellaceae bacterium]|nr:trehalose-6-phosphate synthase [Stellaceae bacterium]